MEVRAKRSLGQNFLVDPQAAARIVDAAAVSSQDRVVEIGPGKGALTDFLVRRAAEVVAVEKDDDLHALLAERFAGHPSIQVLHQDALTWDVDSLPPGTRWKVVANLPYNVATPIVLRLLARGDLFSDLVLMFQREVALRFAANPGGRDYGIPSVLAKVYADSYPLFAIPPGAFRPIPKVVSTVVRFRVLPQPRVPPGEMLGFEKTLRAGFHGRRKTLLNSLMHAAETSTRGGEAIRDAVRAWGGDSSRRAETLSLEEFLALSRLLFPSPG